MRFAGAQAADAGGIVGIGAVARAKPDGYTLLLTSSSYVLLPSIRKQIPYDPYKDFMPIVETGVSPNVFITHPDSGINSVADLIALAKSSDRVNYGTPGIGTTPQLAAEVLKMRAKINMVSVPFSGAAPTVQALLSRQVQVVVAALGSAMPQISGGMVKAIAQTGKERWKAFVPVRAIENSVFHVMANVVGTQSDNMTFFGGAMIVSPRGVFLARGKVDEEDLIVATLDEKELFETRNPIIIRFYDEHDLQFAEKRTTPQRERSAGFRVAETGADSPARSAQAPPF